MNDPPASRIRVGVIGAPHGLRGEVRLHSFTSDPAAVADYRPLLTDRGRPLVLRHARPLKGDLVVASVEGVTSRDAAAALNGTALFVERASLPAAAAEEFYHVDLIGLEVVDETGVPVGRVAAVLNYGAGDILEVAPAAGPSVLVAFTRAFVPHVDLASGRVTIAAAALAGEEG